MSDDMIRVGRLRIDALGRRVFVDEEERHVSRLQFDLLFLLASPPDRAVSYDELYMSVWKELTPHDSRKAHIVTVVVFRLHQQLAPIRIENVYGYGYRLPLEGRP